MFQSTAEVLLQFKTFGNVKEIFCLCTWHWETLTRLCSRQKEKSSECFYSNYSWLSNLSHLHAGTHLILYAERIATTFHQHKLQERWRGLTNNAKIKTFKGSSCACEIISSVLNLLLTLDLIKEFHNIILLDVQRIVSVPASTLVYFTESKYIFREWYAVFVLHTYNMHKTAPIHKTWKI